MKALEKEPNRRYPTANSLADDLQRYLQHEPISAGKPSGWYRLRKFARRNNGPVTAATLVALALIVGIIGTTVGLVEARRQEEIAREETRQKNVALRQEEQQRRLAEKRFAEKREAMDEILRQFSDKRLNALPGTQEIRQVLLARGVEQYESMFRDNRNDRAVRLSLADRYIQLGRVQSEISTLQQALEPLTKAEELLRLAAEREPNDVDLRFRLAVVRYEIGYCYWEHKEHERGLPILKEALAVFKTLREKDANDPRYQLHTALAQTRVAACMTESTDERDELYRQAYESLKRLRDQQPGAPEVLLASARVTISQGDRAYDTSRYADAEKLYDESRHILLEAIKLDPNDARIFTSYRYSLWGLANVYGKTNRLEQGSALLTEAVADMTKQAQVNPAVSLYQSASVYLYGELHKIQLRQGEFE
jgi:tetratricopeptide (TPR) repeat protein